MVAPRDEGLGPDLVDQGQGSLAAGAIRLTVNGAVKQDGDLRDLIWSFPELIVYLSRFYRLEPGDPISTGTPAGVGPVVSGDQVVVHIDGLTDLNVVIRDLATD